MFRKKRNNANAGKKRKPTRIAFIGIDNSGKSTISKKVAKKYEEQEGKTGYMRLGSYSSSNKIAKKAGALLDKIGKIPSKKTAFESLKNTGYYLSFPFFKIIEEKGKKIMIYDRYPRIDLELFKKIHEGKKSTKFFYPLLKTFSGAAYPDIVVVTRRKPEEAAKGLMKRKERNKHENLADLKKMDSALDAQIKQLRKKGIKVIEIHVGDFIKEYGGGDLSAEKAAELIKKKINEILKQETKKA